MSAIDSLKTAYELAKKGATIELQEAIMSLREEVMALQERNLELAQENAALREQAQLKNTVVFERGIYWKMEGEEREGPYCPQCHDANEKLIRLQIKNSNVQGRRWSYYLCQTCKTHFDC